MSNSDEKFEVTILPAGWRFIAPAADSLLHSALQAGIVLPSSCRNGTCRTCLCRLSAGEIEYGIEWPGVSAEERNEGWILPCVSQPRSNLVLEVPAARHADSDLPAARNFSVRRP